MLLQRNCEPDNRQLRRPPPGTSKLYFTLTQWTAQRRCWRWLSTTSKTNRFPVDALEWNSTFCRPVHIGWGTNFIVSLASKLKAKMNECWPGMLRRRKNNAHEKQSEQIESLQLNASFASSRAVKGFVVRDQANTLQIKRQLIIAYYSTSLNGKHTLGVCLCMLLLRHITNSGCNLFDQEKDPFKLLYSLYESVSSDSNQSESWKRSLHNFYLMNE